MTRTIDVYGDWVIGEQPFKIGTMVVDRIRGKESLSFTYDADWLARPDALSLDPELQLYQGLQFPPSDKQGNFGVFLDSSPDRWGRMLMQRREAQRSKREGRPQKPLMDSDYLLGVHDEQRMGALRFCHSPGGPFLSDEADVAAPPWTALRELEQAAWIVQSDAPEAKLDQSLRILLAPGSSIGGARPKAGVTDENNELWIAKFPGRSDGRDVAAWEMVAFRIAQQGGLRVPEAKLQRFGKRHHTFISKRFDRVTAGGIRRRRHFASAMTMLSHVDGADHSSGASYLELAQWIIQNQSIVDDDLEELWRRIVFAIQIRNTDDHLRNHGFLLTDEGWRLSPAYDLNPDPQGIGLSLNISETDNSLDLDLARSVAPYFRVNAARAQEIISQISEAVRDWRRIASELRISKSEQNDMENAFGAS
jgi:serine/threonine-protein kinase HipA